MGAQHPRAELDALWVTPRVPRPGFVPISSQAGALWLSPGGSGWRWEHGCDGFGSGVLPLPPVGRWADGHGCARGHGDGDRQLPPRQAALGRGSDAHATRVTTPRVLSPAAISFFRGRGTAEACPQGHPGHPGTLSPLPAKCCVSSVGVDLRYHLVAALPSRGHRCRRL